MSCTSQMPSPCHHRSGPSLAVTQACMANVWHVFPAPLRFNTSTWTNPVLDDRHGYRGIVINGTTTWIQIQTTSSKSSSAQSS